MQKVKIEKNTVQETLIVPLYGRKICSEKFPDLYTDVFAKELCGRIDYDFTNLEKRIIHFCMNLVLLKRL